jgi:hypothetical protein
MEFNIRVKNKIKDAGFQQDDILTYLTALYYNLKPSFIPELVKKQTNVLNIVERDYKHNTLKWNYKLFVENELPAEIDKWAWVDSEYRSLFKAVRTTAGGSKRACIIKMKKFMESSDATKEDIIKAAMIYIQEFMQSGNDTKYLQQADYFISKNIRETQPDGSVKTITHSKLEQYLEVSKDLLKQNSGNVRGLR